MDAVVAECFGPLLEREGFAPAKPRKWVRSTKRPIREIFEVQALKGAA